VSTDTNFPHTDPDREHFRKLAELRAAETTARCGCSAESNPTTGAEGLVGLVKERGSLPYAIQICEELARLIKTLWAVADPRRHESPYDMLIERLAFQVVLRRHRISQEEVDTVKNMLDAQVTETII
jgi:hypothetical protein